MYAVPKYLAKLHEATTHPPAVLPQDDDAVAAGIPWVLLDLEAYVADVRNRTTAYSYTERRRRIQVTFCLAAPPRVSFFAVSCPDAVFPMEHEIVAMDEDLVLLHVVVSPEDTIYKERHLFIYQADGDKDGGPSLHRIQPPPGHHYYFSHKKVGLLRCSSGGGGGEKDDFIIAALCRLTEPGVPDDDLEPVSYYPGHTEYALFVYSSKTQAWTVSLVSADEQQQRKQQPGHRFLHFNSKVISIGGEAGTMGFVDLFRGILLCDVLKSDPKLRYIPLPKPIWPGNNLSGDARLHRDIAVVKDRIRYVELQVRWKTDLVTGDEDRYHTDGWTARTFSIPAVAAGSLSAANYDADDWSEECQIKSSDEIDVKDNPSFDLLPRPLDREGRALPPFKSVIVCQPTLSLGDHDNNPVVYFMVKDVPGDDKGWVISISIKGKKLLGAAEFAAERTDVATFAYVHSKISKYLTGAADAKGRHKRHGRMLVRSSTPACSSQIPQPPVSYCLDARM